MSVEPPQVPSGSAPAPIPAPAAAPPQPDADTNLRSSVAALVLGVILAIGVAKLVSLVGVGGDLASQAAGAASGAAPLLIDGTRRRRAITRRLPRVSMAHVRFGRPPLLVASIFGFVLLLIETFLGPVLGFVTRRILIAATGSTDGYDDAFLWTAGLLQVPIVVVVTVLLAIAAAHRMTHHRARWLWFGVAVKTVVQAAMVVLAQISLEAATPAVLVASSVFLGGLLGGLSMIGLAIARRTQAAFTAAAFFNRLSPDDQQAALALLANNDDDPHNDMAVEPMRPRYHPPPGPPEPSPSQPASPPAV